MFVSNGLALFSLFWQFRRIFYCMKLVSWCRDPCIEWCAISACVVCCVHVHVSPQNVPLLRHNQSMHVDVFLWRLSKPCCKNCGKQKKTYVCTPVLWLDRLLRCLLKLSEGIQIFDMRIHSYKEKKKLLHSPALVRQRGWRVGNYLVISFLYTSIALLRNIL